MRPHLDLSMRPHLDFPKNPALTAQRCAYAQRTPPEQVACTSSAALLLLLTTAAAAAARCCCCCCCCGCHAAAVACCPVAAASVAISESSSVLYYTQYRWSAVGSWPCMLLVLPAYVCRLRLQCARWLPAVATALLLHRLDPLGAPPRNRSPPCAYTQPQPEWVALLRCWHGPVWPPRMLPCVLPCVSRRAVRHDAGCASAG